MPAADTARSRGFVFPPLIVALIACAWASLFLWEASPYGRYLNHGDWTAVGLAGKLCAALPGGQMLLPALLYVGGWLLMSAAMMLPTALPLLAIFARLVARRTDGALLQSLVVAGYLLVWAGFGVAAHGLDAVLHLLAGANPWLRAHGGLVGAGVLALAGAFQFTALKYHCLDKCRTPFSFVHEHWRGLAPRREAFALGLHHGVFCVGCCWAIMLLMFVVGVGSVGWMLLLGAVMAMEKNLPWGRSLSAPLGVGLLLWSGAIVASDMVRWPA
jgi:predicted metal-binding membrane protein